MWKLQNDSNKKFVKDAITGKAKVFTDFETVEKWKETQERNSVINSTAWNNVRETTYSIIKIEGR